MLAAQEPEHSAAGSTLQELHLDSLGPGELQPLSGVLQLFVFDFKRPPAAGSQRCRPQVGCHVPQGINPVLSCTPAHISSAAAQVEITQGGTAHALVVWWSLQMTADEQGPHLCTCPSTMSSPCCQVHPLTLAEHVTAFAYASTWGVRHRTQVGLSVEAMLPTGQPPQRLFAAVVRKGTLLSPL